MTDADQWLEPINELAEQVRETRADVSAGTAAPAPLLGALRKLLREVGERYDDSDPDDQEFLRGIALEAVTEIIEICERWTGDPAMPPLGKLAIVLDTFVGLLTDIADAETVLPIVRRTLDWSARWIGADPAVNLSLCAEVFWSQVDHLVDAGRVEEALEHSRRMLSWCEEPLRSDPPECPKESVNGFIKHARLLNRIGSPEDAAACIERALTLTNGLQRPEAREDPVILPLLVQHLGYLTTIGEYGAAADASARVAELQAARSPHNSSYEIAETIRLMLLAGRHGEALAYSDRRMAHLRASMRLSSPEVWALTYSRRAAALAGLHRYEESFECSAQAVLLYEALSSADPDYRGFLAGALATAEKSLRRRDRYEGARSCVARMVRIHDELARSEPDAHLVERADAYVLYAWYLSMFGNFTHAVPAARRVMTLHDELTERFPGRHDHRFADAVIVQLAVFEGAVLHPEVFGFLDSAWLSDLVRASGTVAEHFQAAGMDAEADTVLRRVARLGRHLADLDTTANLPGLQDAMALSPATS